MRMWPKAQTQAAEAHPTVVALACPDCGGVLSQTREGPGTQLSVSAKSGIDIPPPA